MKKVKHEHVLQMRDLFSELYEVLGLDPIAGRLHGIALAEEGPLTLDELGDFGEISRGYVSIYARRLTEMGFVIKTRCLGDRRDYYAAERDMNKVVRGFLDEHLYHRLAPALQLLDEARLLHAKYLKKSGDGAGAFAANISFLLMNLDAAEKSLGRIISSKRKLPSDAPAGGEG
jgi:DNA-binding transcriptional regulator GbsR (MarR family)